MYKLREWSRAFCMALLHPFCSKQNNNSQECDSNTVAKMTCQERIMAQVELKEADGEEEEASKVTNE